MLPKLERGSAHAWLERHPVKFQKVKKWKVKKYTFRLFDFSKIKYTFSYFSTFRLFEIKIYLFLLFDFSTFRNSKRYLWTFRLFKIQNDTFSLFDFSFFDFSNFKTIVFRPEPWTSPKPTPKLWTFDTRWAPETARLCGKAREIGVFGGDLSLI